MTGFPHGLGVRTRSPVHLLSRAFLSWTEENRKEQTQGHFGVALRMPTTRSPVHLLSRAFLSWTEENRKEQTQGHFGVALRMPM
ncbi:hypothetical protein H920_13666 [Fukomys damarensis]|uniref:Uncharacterized protein n=1 Tax=Fukomys damarensis TaxID=885580 RepID=A0A091D3R1_FUKDA|nr:hypothetical protein H920_13666 [Fukomys damarensis]